MDKHGQLIGDKKVRTTMIFPKKIKVTDLIVQWCHYNKAHSGREMTLNEIRCSGFWVISHTQISEAATGDVL